MERALYIECNTGISGDMTVAALLDLGADRAVLDEMLSSLKENVGNFDVKISRVAKSGIGACDFDVILDNDIHDHDMAYLYGHEADHHHAETHDHDHHHDHDHEADHHQAEAHDHEHYHDEAHHHDHDHDTDHHHAETHDHDHHHDHHHEHRSFKDVKRIIEETEMTDGARAIAKKIFSVVAEAEAAVHDRPVDEVHFHEVGAVDSIVDILSAAVCFDNLCTKKNIKECIVTSLVDGCGTIRCQHGVIPVPVPAVMKIAEQTGVRISITGRKGEYVTPTGAAFAAAVKTSDKLPESFRVLKVGIGAGKRDYEIPGMVRAILIEA